MSDSRLPLGPLGHEFVPCPVRPPIHLQTWHHSLCHYGAKPGEHDTDGCGQPEAAHLAPAGPCVDHDLTDKCDCGAGEPSQPAQPDDECRWCGRPNAGPNTAHTCWPHRPNCRCGNCDAWRPAQQDRPSAEPAWWRPAQEWSPNPTCRIHTDCLICEDCLGHRTAGHYDWCRTRRLLESVRADEYRLWAETVQGKRSMMSDGRVGLWGQREAQITAEVDAAARADERREIAQLARNMARRESSHAIGRDDFAELHHNRGMVLLELADEIKRRDMKPREPQASVNPERP